MVSYRRTGNNLYDMVDRFLNDGFSVNTPLRNIILDVQEFDDRYLIEADVPGVDRKDIDVTFNNDYLKIAVDDRHETEDKSDSQQPEADMTNQAQAHSTTTAGTGSDATRTTTEGEATEGETTAGGETTASDGAADDTQSTQSNTSEDASATVEDTSHYIHRERMYATLNRVVYLKDATSKGIKAELKDGVLTLTVPKREDAMNQNQKIKID